MTIEEEMEDLEIMLSKHRIVLESITIIIGFLESLLNVHQHLDTMKEIIDFEQPSSKPESPKVFSIGTNSRSETL